MLSVYYGRHVWSQGADNSYSVAHAQFVWDIKAEPGIVSLFEQIWGTDKLTVSFGAFFLTRFCSSLVPIPVLSDPVQAARSAVANR